MPGKVYMLIRWLLREIRGKYAWLAGLTVLYLLVRLMILFFAIDQVGLDEELYRGNVAKELVSGPVLPFFDYQRSRYEGGSLVSGLLAAPFFLLFGAKLISLKLTGLLAGTGIFILNFIFLRKFFNNKTAVCASLLFIFLPPGWIKASISNYGAQYEAMFFTILAVFLLFRDFFTAGLGKNIRLSAILGAICGFGMFFHYSFLPTLLTIILFWYISDKGFIFSKQFIVFCLAFLAGLTPWFCYNLTHAFQGLVIYEKPFSYWLMRNSPAGFFTGFYNFLAADVPGALTFADPFLKFEPRALLENRFCSRIYYFVFMVSFLGILWRRRKEAVALLRGLIPFARPPFSLRDVHKELFLLSLFVVFGVVLALSGLPFNVNFYDASIYRYRQVGPIGFLFPAVIAIFLYGNNPGPRRNASGFLKHFSVTVLLTLGVVSNSNFISKSSLEKAGFSAVYRGYNYYDLGRVIAWRFDGSSRWFDSVSRIRDGEERRYCYSGMGWGYAEENFDNDYRNYLGKEINKIEKAYWPYAYEWMGEALERELKYDRGGMVDLNGYLDPAVKQYFYIGIGREAAREVSYDPEYAVMDFHKRFPEEDELFIYTGMGVELFDLLVDQPEKFFRFTRMLEDRQVRAVYAGMGRGKEYYRFLYGEFGFGIGRAGYDAAKWEKLVNRVDDKYRPLCYQRLGIEAGWRLVHGLKDYPGFLKRVSGSYDRYLYKGLGIGIGWRFAYDLKSCAKLIQKFDRQFRGYIYEGLGMGVSRRYAYNRNGWSGQTACIPPEYLFDFENGIENDLGRPYGGKI